VGRVKREKSDEECIVIKDEPENWWSLAIFWDGEGEGSYLERSMDTI
jgi:hypothetical protein